jgi:antirestriction protein ArdC
MEKHINYIDSETVYKGMNDTILETAYKNRGYEDREWATFVQWKNAGYKLKDAKGMGVTCRHVHSGQRVKKYNAVSKKTTTTTEGFYMNYFTLFNKAHAVKIDTKCPRCKNDIGKYPALSRKDNRTKICSQCGTAEALQEHFKRETVAQ